MKNIDGNKMLHNETLDVTPLNDFKKACNSCTIYIVLFAVFFITNISISSVFIYFQWYLKKNNIQWYLRKYNVRIKFNLSTQKTNY